MEKIIAVLPGDGIGPEIIQQAVKVLQAVADKYQHSFHIQEYAFGGAAIDYHGQPLPDETLAACQAANAVLMGAVGGPKWDDVPKEIRPEKGLLALRKRLGLYANLRPSQLFSQLKAASPLRADISEQGFDFVIVRELTGGIYFGNHHTFEEDGQTYAEDNLRYSEAEIRRILTVAFTTAQKRNKKLCLVDKANVLDSSKLWRKICQTMAPDYPDVDVNYMYVDNAAMQIVGNPSQFDTIVTENMFGDILSDVASMITGSIGMIPSASMADGSFGLYEPIHGSAPDIAGQNIANPIGTIRSAAMMLNYSLGLSEEARAIEKAVDQFLDQGYRSADTLTPGMQELSCSAIGDYIAQAIQ